MNTAGVGAGHARMVDGCMTVDVEDYFQVSAFESHVTRSAWNDCESRLEANVARLLERFAEHDARATFFVLGWVARAFPSMVRSIAAAGHEVASHGYEHRRVTSQTEREFEADVTRTRALLEDVTGQRVIGYRAASFSIDASVPWAHDVLARTGHLYSSSLHPIRHDHYGVPDADREIARGPSGLVEYPISTCRVGETNLPCGGGGYFRLFPYGLSRACLRRAARQLHSPLMFYFHPWEIDPGQPRMGGLPLRTRFRHYVGLRAFERKLARLLADFRWGRTDEALRASGAIA